MRVASPPKQDREAVCIWPEGAHRRGRPSCTFEVEAKDDLAQAGAQHRVPQALLVFSVGANGETAAARATANLPPRAPLAMPTSYQSLIVSFDMPAERWRFSSPVLVHQRGETAQVACCCSATTWVSRPR